MPLTKPKPPNFLHSTMKHNRTRMLLFLVQTGRFTKQPRLVLHLVLVAKLL